MKVAAHARERITERLGLRGDAIDRLAAKALERGIRHSDAAGSLRRWLDKQVLTHHNSELRIYGEFVWCIHGETIATVLPLPGEYRAAVAKLRRRAA